MSTPAEEPRPPRRYTTAEIEAELANAPHPAAAQTCQELCLQWRTDQNDLDNISEVEPPSTRARLRLLLLRDAAATYQKMRQQKCPNCPD